MIQQRATNIPLHLFLGWLCTSISAFTLTNPSTLWSGLNFHHHHLTFLTILLHRDLAKNLPLSELTRKTHPFSECIQILTDELLILKLLVYLGLWLVTLPILDKWLKNK